MIRQSVLASAITMAVMAAASLWAWHALPASDIAMHFDMHGEPNGFAPKWVALTFLPAIGLLISVVMASLPRLSPSRSRLGNSVVPYNVNWVGGMVVLGTLHVLLIAKAAGSPIDVVRSVCAMVGALFVVSGNYYGKIRYNYVFGLRTPWTLASEDVWDRTHRFVGRAMVASAAILLGAVFLVPSPVALAILMAALVGLPVISGIFYSVLITPRGRRSGGAFE
jgi:uncharacterized membrane protein